MSCHLQVEIISLLCYLDPALTGWRLKTITCSSFTCGSWNTTKRHPIILEWSRWNISRHSTVSHLSDGPTICIPSIPQNSWEKLSLCQRCLYFLGFFVNWCGKNRPEKHRRPVGIRRVPKIANEGLFQKEAKKSTVKKVSEMPRVSHLCLVMRLIESPVVRNKEVSYPALLRAAKEAARWDSGLAFSSRGPTTKHCGWKKKRSNVTLW